MIRLRPVHKILAVACALATVLIAAPASEAAKRSVPLGFFSATADLNLFGTADQQALTGQGQLMARSGVESIRVPFIWYNAQPYANALQVPPQDAANFEPGPGGVPTSFADTDRVVRFAATAGLRLLPMVYRTPRWASSRPDSGFYYTYMPRDSNTFANYMRALVARYGPAGSFWSANPDVPRIPIREWQIYNEITRLGGVENQTQLAAATYIPLLRAAYRAIHRADRGAKVVAAGLHNISWQAMDRFYRRGWKGTFDVAALHVYTRSLQHVMEVIRLGRRVMRRYHDRRPLYITETTWSSAQGKLSGGRPIGIERTDSGQGRMLQAT